MRILFVAPELPVPARRGFQTRALHQLRYLSERHQLTLVCLDSRAPQIIDERAPNLPKMDMTHMGALQTLGAIVDYMRSLLEAEAPASPAGCRPRRPALARQ